MIRIKHIQVNINTWTKRKLKQQTKNNQMHKSHIASNECSACKWINYLVFFILLLNPKSILPQRTHSQSRHYITKDLLNCVFQTTLLGRGYIPFNSGSFYFTHYLYSTYCQWRNNVKDKKNIWSKTSQHFTQDSNTE